MNVAELVKSKTLWGTLLAVLGFLSQPSVLAVLPEKVAAVITAVGVVLGVFGLRVAVAKSGPPPA